MIGPRLRFSLRSANFTAGLTLLSMAGLAAGLAMVFLRRRESRLRLARHFSTLSYRMADRIFPGIVYLRPFNDYYYRLVHLAYPRRVTAGSLLQVRVALENLGSERWAGPEGPYPCRLGTWNPENHESPFRDVESWIRPDRPAGLNGVVDPGGIGSFELTFRAPAHPGRYREELAPVADGRGWFPGERIVIDIKVGEGAGRTLSPRRPVDDRHGPLGT